MGASEPWAFGLVGEVIERSWIVWVLKRMNNAVEEKVGGGFVPLASLRSIHVFVCMYSPSYGQSCRRVSNA